jgi:phosphatidylserine/phosphatidylglycerophosphate/cardiolipin synthase-like enzyme
VILFLAFYPGQSGNDCIIGEAVDIAEKDASLLIAGAVSDAKAMPGYKAANKKTGEKGVSPITYQRGNISLVRASRIDDKAMLGDFGAEELTPRGATGAIIHDKLIVVDPLSDDCAVVLGSHNLGFKASYSNDENMLIIRGDRAIAEAYAVHILDVYDHYRFRAVQAELKAMHKKGWSGSLETNDEWMQPYLAGNKGALMRYFARGG